MMVTMPCSWSVKVSAKNPTYLRLGKNDVLAYQVLLAQTCLEIVPDSVRNIQFCWHYCGWVMCRRLVKSIRFCCHKYR